MIILDNMKNTWTYFHLQNILTSYYKTVFFNKIFIQGLNTTYSTRPMCRQVDHALYKLINVEYLQFLKLCLLGTRIHNN